jgi:membrane fusion protein, multidrug efflux system
MIGRRNLFLFGQVTGKMIRSHRGYSYSWMRSTWRTASPPVFVAIFALASGCAKPQAAPPGRPPTTVSVGKVSQKTEPVEVIAVGNVEAISTIAIRAQVAGAVQDVNFKEGDFVKKGQVLLTIDPRPYEATLAQAKAALARDKATGAYNRAQAQRYKSLFDQGVVPAEQVDSYTSAADASDATANSDEAAIKSAELNLEFCTINSPIDGRTGTIMVKPGNLVKVADVPIVIINQVNPIYVNFTIPQQYWPDIKEHVDRGALHVMATIPQDQGPPVQGTLTFVDNNVDANTGTIHLRGTFENQQNRLWPGLFVSILLTLSEQPNATIVPAQSIVSTQQGSYVYVVKPNNTVEQRTVVPTRTINGDTVVEKGLQPGETIVTDGQVNLIPGSKIEIKHGDAGPTNSAAGPSDRQSGAADPPADKSSRPEQK